MGVLGERRGSLSSRIRRRLRPHESGLVFDDGVSSWMSAVRASRGYADDAIFDRVVTASRSVASGAAAYERDGVAFPDVSYSWPVVLGTLLARGSATSPVRVLDFGGSLGTAYFQNRPAIPPDVPIAWDVVEQPHYVEEGNRHFSTAELTFHDDLSKYLSLHRPDFCYVGSSLQYLENPHDTLNQLAQATSRALVLDRLPVALTHSADVPVIERVPAHIYPADYAMWVFGSDGPVRNLSRDWVVRWTFDSIGGTMRTLGGISFKWCGWLMVRANTLDEE